MIVTHEHAYSCTVVQNHVVNKQSRTRTMVNDRSVTVMDAQTMVELWYVLWRTFLSRFLLR